MGCSISNERVQPPDEEKEEDKNEDVSKATEDSQAKVEAQEAPKEKSEESKESKEEENQEKDENDKDREEAATTIQAAFRGHHARKNMKETESSTKQTGTKSNSEPTKEELLKEYGVDDKVLCAAATKIQASFRGHMSRNEQAASLAVKAAETVQSVAAEVEEKVQNTVNELEGIDLTDPDLHKAATKIQASFRGHKVRQEVMANPASADEAEK